MTKIKRLTVVAIRKEIDAIEVLCPCGERVRITKTMLETLLKELNTPTP